MTHRMVNHTDRVAAVVIPRTSKKEKYLVAKRVDNGNWEFPGGKENLDEELDREKGILGTAEREIKEELNLDVRAKESNDDYIYKGGGYDIFPVYAVHIYDDADQYLELLEDHDDYKWIDPQNLPEDIELEDEKNCLEAFDLL